AKILNVQLDMEEKSAKVGVLEDQLSLAIGKAGQNVRLAARLTGLKIDINGEKITPEGEVEAGESEVVAEEEHIAAAPEETSSEKGE
ncbi:MAG: N utilization substance protein A, partial [Candidatus Doudnabacteria bacterium Gr01-1014_77]